MAVAHRQAIDDFRSEILPSPLVGLISYRGVIKGLDVPGIPERRPQSLG